MTAESMEKEENPRIRALVKNWAHDFYQKSDAGGGDGIFLRFLQ